MVRLLPNREVGSDAMDARILGQNIKKYRKEAGFTQDKAAELSGLSVPYFRQIELGNKTPRLETFIRIAEALHVSADRLLSGNVSWTPEIITGELQEQLDRLPREKKQYILTVLDTMIKNT